MYCVLAGETALFRCGLSSQQIYKLYIWTDDKEIPNGLSAIFVRYFYNEQGKDLKYTVCSPRSSNIYEPTKERAVVESIKFHDYFNEGILIEALQSYLYQVEDLSLLYEVADYFKVNHETIDYWLNEAREESDMSMD